MINGIKDLDLKLLEMFSDKSLSTFSMTCKKAKEMCDTEMLWMKKTMHTLQSAMDPAIIQKFKKTSKLNWKNYYKSMYFLINFASNALQEADDEGNKFSNKKHFASQVFVDLVNFESWSPSRKKEIRMISYSIYDNTYQNRKSPRILLNEVLINKDVAFEIRCSSETTKSEIFIKGRNDHEIEYVLSRLLEQDSFLYYGKEEQYSELIMSILRGILPEGKGLDLFLKKRGTVNVRKRFFFLCLEFSVYYDFISIVLKYMGGDEILLNVIESFSTIDYVLDKVPCVAVEALYKGADISLLDRAIQEEEEENDGYDEEDEVSELKVLRDYLSKQEFKNFMKWII